MNINAENFFDKMPFNIFGIIGKKKELWWTKFKIRPHVDSIFGPQGMGKKKNH